jgi:predicted secreted protein
LALAGHAILVQVAATDIAGSEVDGLTSVDFGVNADLLETTDFADTSGAKTRIAGLKDVEVTLSGDYESADTGQALLVSSFASGATVYVRFGPNGTTGIKAGCKVESYKISGAIDGKVEVSFSLKATAALGTF